MLSALAAGFLLGLTAGLAPGPLMALVITQSLRHGTREGIKVALAPLITDAPIILAAVTLATQIREWPFLLGVLSVGGGLFVLYLAWDTLRSPGAVRGSDTVSPGSWRKGLLTNLLSPHPWLFWITVGAATLARALTINWATAALFLLVFYSWLVGSKVLLAAIAGRSRAWLHGPCYRAVLRFLALLLVVYAAILIRDGCRLLLQA